MNIAAEPRITRESILLRSESGDPLLAFDTIDKARTFNEKFPGEKLCFFQQTITETELVL